MAEQTRVGARRRPDASRPGKGSSTSSSKQQASSDDTDAERSEPHGTDAETTKSDENADKTKPNRTKSDKAKSDGGDGQRSSASGDRATKAVPAESRWSDPDDDGPAVGAAETDTTAAGSTGDAPAPASPLGQLKSLVRTRGPIRARKVHRIVRRVDPWSILKLCLLFYLCVWVMSMVAVILLWGVAVGSGTIGSLENFIAEFLAFEEFRFNGDQLFQVVALGGLIGVFVATAVSAVLAVVFNLIADLTGGIRFTVVEEESARRILRTAAEHTGSTAAH